MGNLQISSGSMETLRARFEVKATTQKEVRNTFRAAPSASPHKAVDMPLTNGEAEGEPKSKTSAGASVVDATDDHMRRKVNKITVNFINII